jgi:hypothetical protein
MYRVISRLGTLAPPFWIGWRRCLIRNWTSRSSTWALCAPWNRREPRSVWSALRRALLAVEGIRQVTVRLGDHCAAAEIEGAVNAGRTFAEAFPGEGAGSLAELRLTFLRKGFLGRQQLLLRELGDASFSPAAICALRLGEVFVRNDTILIRRSYCAPVEGGSAQIMERYLQRRAELGLDCSPSAPLIVDLEGEMLSADQLLAHYETARTIRVGMEANGSFCRALLSLHRLDAGASGAANTGAQDV